MDNRHRDATGLAAAGRQTGSRPHGPAAAALSPGLPALDSALFFDFDGTLVDLAQQPDSVTVQAGLPAMLGRLGAALGAAVAVVSGRPVGDIDRYLHPLKLCAAGVHGAERRHRDGLLRRIPLLRLDDAASGIEALCAHFPALHVERKPGAIALHYRQAPELEALCVDTMLAALEQTRGMTLLRGKMVVEIKPGRATKAAAVREFMDCAPFRNRRPWFFGDDVTDEGAFEFVQSVGGVAVKIGDGETLAAYRLPDPAALHAWLDRAAQRLNPAGESEVRS